MSQNNYRIATLALHAGQSDDPATHAQAVPIYSTVAYNFTSTEHAANLFALKEFGNIYSRLMNPTCDVLEKRLAAINGGAAALVLASGQAAITAAIATITHTGQNIVSSSSLYGGTFTLFSQTLKQYGIDVRFFDPNHPEQISDLIDANTRAVYIESVGNPRNVVPDFRAIADIAHHHHLPFIVDNTVTPPPLFSPIEHGADIVIYSTTKYLGGHGVHIGGAIIDSGNFPWADNPQKWPEFTQPDPAYHGVVLTEALKPVGNIAYIIHARTHWLRDTGACQSPFGAFLTLLGVETLPLRMRQHCQNALAIAQWLNEHPAVHWVNYPGLPNHHNYELAKKYLPNGQGAIIGFGIEGGASAAVKFINSVKLASHVANIGDAKTLVIHPASTTHSQLNEEELRKTGVSPSFVRLCVGIEDVQDIMDDLDQALRASQ